MIVRYDGPGGRLQAFGKTLDRGEQNEFSEAEVLSLQAQPHIHITVIEPAVKRPSAKSDSLAAATASEASPSGDGEPEAHPGEGHPDYPKE